MLRDSEGASGSDCLLLQAPAMSVVAALVLSNAHTVLMELNSTGVDANLDHRSRLQWYRVEVRAHLCTACLIDTREAHSCQVEVFRGKRQQMLLLGKQHTQTLSLRPAINRFSS